MFVSVLVFHLITDGPAIPYCRVPRWVCPTLCVFRMSTSTVVFVPRVGMSISALLTPYPNRPLLSRAKRGCVCIVYAQSGYIYLCSE